MLLLLVLTASAWLASSVLYVRQQWQVICLHEVRRRAILAAIPYLLPPGLLLLALEVCDVTNHRT